MKTKILKITLLLFAFITLTSYANQKGYHVRLTWTGDSRIFLIFRNPIDKNVSSSEYTAFDCRFGNDNPEWGITDYKPDNPQWIDGGKIAGINYQDVTSEELFDPGQYSIIARLISTAQFQTAECRIDILRWNHKDVNKRYDKIPLSTDDPTYPIIQEQLYEDMNTRVYKFKQKKNGKYLIKLNASALPDKITTNDLAQLYLNNYKEYADSNWESNKKETKYFIDKPWTFKVVKKNKEYIYVRGIAENYYENANIKTTIMIGDYIGTNSFVTDKQAKYKYKPSKDSNND